MAPWIARRLLPATWKRVPWKMAWAVALWLAEKGRERFQTNLTEKERQEVVQIVKRSKGRPDKLPQRDRTRLKNIAEKAIRG